MKCIPIYLTSNDLQLFSKYKIGNGTDGSVYRIPSKLFNLPKGTLFKIYHRDNPIFNQSVLTDDIKIYKKDEVVYNNKTEHISYFCDDDEVRISSKDAIYKAIERQEKINMTDLPKNVLYIDNRFSGCILKEQRGKQIHYMSGLPMSLKCKIMKKVLLKVQELMDNYVYPTDIANSPFGKSFYPNQNGVLEHVGHSHILVNQFTLEPNLIDLDGKSAIYMEHYNSDFYNQAVSNFNVLFIEFLFDISLDEIFEDTTTIYYLQDYLTRFNISNDYIQSLSNLSLSLNEADKILNNGFYKKKKLY